MKLEHIAAIAIPLLTAALYLFGLSYHEGYLEVYGLDSSLFPITSDVALFKGFLSLSTSGIKPLLYSISVAYLICILYLNTFTNFSLNNFLFTYLSKKSSSDKNQHPLLFSVSLLSLVFSMIFILLLFSLTAYSGGKKQATLEQQEYIAKKITVTNLKYKQNDNLIHDYENAKLITCNTTACSYWMKTKKNESDVYESHILQLDRIEKTTVTPKI